MPSRVMGCVVGLLLVVTTACGSASLPGGAAPDAGPSASPSVDSTPRTEPVDCGTGQARDLESAMRIITDGDDCAGSTNRFWRQELGDRWTTPKIFSYDDGDIPETTCAEDATAEDFADNAFYCPLDDVIAYSNQLMERLFQQGGPYLPVVVLQHELGHRANNLADNEGVVSRSEENQADCQAGASTRFALRADRLPATDVLKSMRLLFELGDVSNFGDEMADEPGAHGTPPQRVIAYSRGFGFGVDNCARLGQDPTGHTL